MHSHPRPIAALAAILGVLVALVAAVLVAPSARAAAAGAPRWVSAVPGDASVTVSWLPPTSGDPVTAYEVELAPGGVPVTLGAAARTHTFTAQSNATTFTATVTSISDGATGGAADSNPVTTQSASTFTCAKWAAAAGDDAAAGAQATPKATLRGLVAALTPGQTGCVKAGDTIDDAGGYGILNNSGTAVAPITVRSGPGGRASVSGLIHVPEDVHDIVLTDLNLVGPTTGAGKNSMLLIDGDRVSVTGNDITYPLGICVDVGTPGAGYVASNTLVARNRIHHCGVSPALVWTEGDSGAHGMYIKSTDRIVVADNVIDHNKYRGLQTYPNPKSVAIVNNVFDSNATNVNIGQLLTSGYVSENVLVSNNAITNATLWEVVPGFGKNPAQVHSTVPTNTYNNLVERNCMFIADPSKNFDGTAGYTQDANTIVASGAGMYVDAAAGNYTLPAGSPCSGFGPRTPAAVITPPAVTTTLVRSTVSPSVGSPMSFTATVSNTGTQVATDVDAVFSVDPSYGTVSATSSQGSCGAINVTHDLLCGLGDVPGSSSASITFVATPSSTAASYLSFKAYPANAAPSPTSTVFTTPSATDPDAPQAPAGVSVTGGVGKATVAWTEPPGALADAVSGYSVTTIPGNKVVPVAAAARSVVVPGLAAGTSYTFSVRAVNLAGAGPSRSGVVKGSVARVSLSPASVKYGSSSAVRGSLTSSSGAALAGRPVSVWSRPSGSSSFTLLRNVTTSSSGAFSVPIKPKRGTAYRAQFAGAAGQMGVLSGAVGVTVTSTAAVTLSKSKISVGGKSSVRVKTGPARGGLRVTLQRKVGGVWKTVSTKSTSTSGKVTFSVKGKKSGKQKLRVKVAASTGLGSGYSRSVTLTVR